MSIKTILSTLLLCFITVSANAKGKSSDSLNVRYATKAEAEKLITAPDNFSQGLNQFDLDLRLRKPNSTKEEWLQLVAKETMEWTKADIEKAEQAFAIIKANIQKMNLHISYPKEVIMLKTSMREELDAGGYTRKNWIAISHRDMQLATAQQLSVLFGHELFHVLSRHNADFKKAVYGTLGFKMIGHEIEFPKDILEKRISNPDIAHRDSYITLNIDGQPTRCAEIIYTTKPYTSGSIMDYLNVGFIPLNKKFKPIVKNGETVIYPIQMVAKEFKSYIGSNTNYIIDPEEVSADHFSFLVTNKKGLPNPEIIENIRKSLQK